MSGWLKLRFHFFNNRYMIFHRKIFLFLLKKGKYSNIIWGNILVLNDPKTSTGHLYWNHILAWVFSLNLLHFFRTPFPKNTYEGLLLSLDHQFPALKAVFITLYEVLQSCMKINWTQLFLHQKCFMRD